VSRNVTVILIYSRLKPYKYLAYRIKWFRVKQNLIYVYNIDITDISLGPRLLVWQ
jgi:hypothetical protein